MFHVKRRRFVDLFHVEQPLIAYQDGESPGLAGPRARNIHPPACGQWMFLGRPGGYHRTTRTDEVSADSKQITYVPGTASDYSIEPPG